MKGKAPALPVTPAGRALPLPGTRPCTAPALRCRRMHSTQFFKQANQLLSSPAISAVTLTARPPAGGRPEPPDRSFDCALAPHQQRIHLEERGRNRRSGIPGSKESHEGTNSSQTGGFSAPCPAGWRRSLRLEPPHRSAPCGSARGGGFGRRRWRLRQGEPRRAQPGTTLGPSLPWHRGTQLFRRLGSRRQRDVLGRAAPELSGSGHRTESCSRSLRAGILEGGALPFWVAPAPAAAGERLEGAGSV